MHKPCAAEEYRGGTYLTGKEIGRYVAVVAAEPTALSGVVHLPQPRRYLVLARGLLYKHRETRSRGLVLKK